MGKLKQKFESIVKGSAKLKFDPLANDEPRYTQIRLDDIVVDSSQPRKDLGDLEGLIASIKEHGIMNPLIVSPLDETKYQLIAGERRYTAAKTLKLRTIPALIRTVKQQERLQLQLVENLHRKDLNPFEEADGYQRLLNEFNLTQLQVAEQIGKPRTHVTQTMSLCKIPKEIREKCQNSDIRISRDVLYNIAKQDNPEKMWDIVNQVLGGSNIQEVREIARKGKPRTAPETTPKPKKVFKVDVDTAVIVQSKTDTLNKKQIISALNTALNMAKEEEY